MITFHYAPWTDEAIQRLRLAWHDPDLANRDLPERLGRTLHSIRAKAFCLKLGPRPKDVDTRRLSVRKQMAMPPPAAVPEPTAPTAPTAIPEPEPEPEPIRTVERVARRCLCCSVDFVAPGRFIRRCNNCRTQSAGMAA